MQVVLYSWSTHLLLNQLSNFKFNLDLKVKVEVLTGLVGTTAADDICIYVCCNKYRTIVVAYLVLTKTRETKYKQKAGGGGRRDRPHARTRVPPSKLDLERE